ncbi:MAG: transposase, partial [Sulfobacillus benefaciens]
MYRTQSNQIKGLDKNEYEALREMCRYAKNLYNVGLYSIRQYFFAEGRYLRYESNYQVVKDNENYALLQAGV